MCQPTYLEAKNTERHVPVVGGGEDHLGGVGPREVSAAPCAIAQPSDSNLAWNLFKVRDETGKALAHWHSAQTGTRNIQPRVLVSGASATDLGVDEIRVPTVPDSAALYLPQEDHRHVRPFDPVVEGGGCGSSSYLQLSEWSFGWGGTTSPG